MGFVKEDLIEIGNDKEMEWLLGLIVSDENFAERVLLTKSHYKKILLNFLEVDIDDFNEKYFAYLPNKNVHISESQFGYFWISNMGLVGRKKQYENELINSLSSQYIVVSLLIEKALEVSKKEEMLDVDGYYFSYIGQMTPALFHNTLFYFELFAKSYLSICKINFKKTHNLRKLMVYVNRVIEQKKQKNTMFYVFVYKPFEELVQYIEKIPGDFKEEFVKYNDNTVDTTLIPFSYDNFLNAKNVFDTSYDFICDYDDSSEKSYYVKDGLYDRLIERATSDDDLRAVEEAYSYLIE